MDEATGVRHAGFSRMQAVLTAFRGELVRFVG
jgi:hypothetical protein